MQEYTIHRSSRKCQASDRPFEPGERYYSMVFQRGSDLVRHDFSKENWQGPVADSVGWWVSQMPAKPTGKQTMAPTPVLLDTLEKLCEEPENSDLAYLLAILLVRRRILVEHHDSPLDDTNPQLHLIHSSDHREFLVSIHSPTSNRAQHLQQKLIDLLYCES